MTSPAAPRNGAPPRRRAAWALALLLGLGACATAPPPPRSGADALDDWLAAQARSAAEASAAPAAPDPADPADPTTAEAAIAAELGSPAEPARGAGVVVAAMGFLGVRYRRGGSSSEQGFDCSGFTHHVFETSLGLLLPRRSRDQARAAGLQRVGREHLQPGDLVFFNTRRAAYSHVGIYIGEGRFIHAPRTGASVRVEDMRGAYWRQRYDGARRAVRPAADVAAVPGSADGGQPAF